MVLLDGEIHPSNCQPTRSREIFAICGLNHGAECRIYASVNKARLAHCQLDHEDQLKNWIKVQLFSYEKTNVKMSFAKWRPFYFGLNVLICPTLVSSVITACHGRLLRSRLAPRILWRGTRRTCMCPDHATLHCVKLDWVIWNAYRNITEYISSIQIYFTAFSFYIQPCNTTTRPPGVVCDSVVQNCVRFGGAGLCAARWYIAGLCEARWYTAVLCAARRYTAGLCAARWCAAGSCAARWHTTGLCAARWYITGLCAARGYTTGLCAARGYTTWLCAARWCAAGLCAARWHTTGLCATRGYTAGLCAARWCAAGLCAALWHTTGLCAARGYTTGLCAAGGFTRGLCAARGYTTGLCAASGVYYRVVCS